MGQLNIEYQLRILSNCTSIEEAGLFGLFQDKWDHFATYLIHRFLNKPKIAGAELSQARNFLGQVILIL